MYQIGICEREAELTSEKFAEILGGGYQPTEDLSV